MAIYQTLIDFDKMIVELRNPPIVINELELNTQEARDALKKQTITEYETDFVALVPKCDCGHLKGNFNLNIKCPKCNSHAKNTIEDIEPRVWFQAPPGIAGLINPVAFMMMSRRFTKNRFSVLDYLLDRNSSKNIKKPQVYYDMKDANIPRGLNNFVTNFDEIFDWLRNHDDFKSRSEEQEEMDRFFLANRHKLFPRHLPFINKSLLIVESGNMGVFVDKFVVDIIDILNSIVQCCTLNFKPVVLEGRVARNLIKLRDLYATYIAENLSPKEGQFRQHVFGSRTNFSFRAVITSITHDVKTDEIHAPWSVGVTVMRHHLVNKLLRRGLDINQAVDLINRSVSTYNEVISGLLDELIAESPWGGLPCILQRNPSLLQGSCIFTRVTKFKKDASDNTISMPTIIMRPLNADLDGDEVNVSLAVDNKLARLWHPLKFQFNIFRLDEPLKPHEDIYITKQLAACASNFLSV